MKPSYINLFEQEIFMKIAITGGAGFIGSHLVNALEKDHEVLVIDNLRTGYLKNIEGSSCTFVNKSVEAPVNELKELLKGCDTIVHLAALVSVPESMENPLLCIDINTKGTANIIEAGRLAGVSQVILASTSAVYGDNPDLPLKENYLPAPLSPYAVSKLDGEYFLKIYSKAYGMDTCAFRFFNVYGPKQDPGSMYSGVISKFMAAVNEKEDITIFGDGLQERDFVYVGDLVQIIKEAIEKRITGLYNIATGVPITVKELAERVISLSKVPVKINYKPARSGDIYKSLASIKRLESKFKTGTSTNLAKGLEKTLSWFTESKKN